MGMERKKISVRLQIGNITYVRRFEVSQSVWDEEYYDVCLAIDQAMTEILDEVACERIKASNTD